MKKQVDAAENVIWCLENKLLSLKRYFVKAKISQKSCTRKHYLSRRTS